MCVGVANSLNATCHAELGEVHTQVFDNACSCSWIVTKVHERSNRLSHDQWTRD